MSRRYQSNSDNPFNGNDVMKVSVPGKRWFWNVWYFQSEKELRTLDERTLEEAVKSTSRHTWWDHRGRRWVSGGPRPWLVLCRSRRPSRPGTTQQSWGVGATKLHPGVAPNGLGDPRAQSLNIARRGWYLRWDAPGGQSPWAVGESELRTGVPQLSQARPQAGPLHFPA